MPKAKPRRGRPSGARTSKSVPGSDGSFELNAGTVSLVETSRLFESIPRGPKNVELKYVDTGISFTVGAGTFQLLNGLVPGVGLSQRIGREVTFHALDFNLRFVTYVAAIAGNNLCAAFVVDHQPDAAQFATNDLLMTGSSQALVNPLNIQRFQLLRRWDTHFYSFSTTATSVTTPTNHPLMFGRIAFRAKTNYNAGTAGTIADIQTNSIYLHAVTDNGGLLTGNVRLWYSDQ